MPSRTALLIAVVAGMLLAGCKAELWLDAKIVDSAGDAIPGAQARLLRPNFDWAYTEVAPANGCVRTGGTVSAGQDHWQLTVSAPGYKPVFVQIDSPQSHKILFTLTRLSEPAASKLARVKELRCR